MNTILDKIRDRVEQWFLARNKAYLESVRLARTDIQEGRLHSFEEVFGRTSKCRLDQIRNTDGPKR